MHYALHVVSVPICLGEGLIMEWYCPFIRHQVWRRSTALTWSRWGCRRLADNIWLL